jgi:hypothetical protein
MVRHSHGNINRILYQEITILRRLASNSNRQATRMRILDHPSHTGKWIHDCKVTILSHGGNNETPPPWRGRHRLHRGLVAFVQSPLSPHAQPLEEQTHRLPDRRMNNITVAKAAAAEPALPQRSHAEFCSEFPDLSNEYLSLMNVDTQRADIELQQRKEDLQDDIRLLTEAAQHLRAEKVASCHRHPPDETPGSGGAPPSTKTNPDKLSCQHEQMHQPLIGLHAYPIHDNHGARELFSISSNVLSIGSTCSFQ